MFETDDKENVQLHTHGKLHTSPSPKRLKTTRDTMHSQAASAPLPLSLYHLFNQDAETKAKTLTWINQELMTCKTHTLAQEIENTKLENQLRRLQEEEALNRDQLEELKRHQQESLEMLLHNYEVKQKRMQLEYESKVDNLKETISDKVETIIREKREKTQKEYEEASTSVQDLKTLLEKTKRNHLLQLQRLRQDHEKRLKDMRKAQQDEAERVKVETDAVNESITNKQEALRILKSTLDSLNSQLGRAQLKVDQLRTKLLSKEASIEVIRLEIDKKQRHISTFEAYFANAERDIASINAEIATVKARYPQLDQERRMLHNRLQELKGNIRVFCRVRPPTKNEKLAEMVFPEQNAFDNEGKQLLGVSRLELGFEYSSHRREAHNFTFDKVFGPKATNNEVFQELSQLIQSSLDGYNVCVFAYGQTGSGKTWTMSHEDGVIPQSVAKIFDDIDELKEEGWTYKVDSQLVEIYNDTIVDLIGPGGAKHEIKHDDVARETTITNVASVAIRGKAHALQVMSKALAKRSTASTMANDRSSRSHSISILKLRGKNAKTGESCRGTLNLIDLAGSERLNASQAKGERLRETQAINKSLSCLGDVIHSLSQKQSQARSSHHTPYRNSKLTYLLKHSLGGDSKTLMFVNISPLAKNFGETISSLRFATKVNSTSLN